MADIPGLIEGAAEGKGLGHEFLRHTERARVIVYLLDPTPAQAMAARQQLEVLRRELALFSDDLAARPHVVALSKADIAAAGGDVMLGAHSISAVTGEGLRPLLHAIADAVDTSVRETPSRPGFQLHRPVPAPFTIRRTDDAWVVEGRDVERAIALDDLTVPEAADVVAQRLERMGVDDALRRAGAVPGDDVRIGTVTFVFRP
jgi:GTP-binding protein